jgi:hypothetical protein
MKRLLFVSIAVILALSFLPLNAFAAKLSEDNLAKKKEGYYVTGLPLIYGNSDDGFGYGARVYLYNNGNRVDPYFDSTPYFMQLYAQFAQTTKGVMYDEINLDMPYIFGSKYRLKTALVFDAEKNANFFGFGAHDSDKHFRNPINWSETFDKYSHLADIIEREKYEQYMKFYKFSIYKPTYFAYVYRDLPADFKVMAGLQFKRVYVRTWEGRGDKGITDQTYTMFDYNRADLNGSFGGWTNYLRLGVSYDTRDFEPDPNSGWYIDNCLEYSTIALGSQYEYAKDTVQVNKYITIVDSLVLTGRIAYTTATTDIPFYEANYFAFSQNRRNGLGGNRTLRGYKKDRFVGRTMTLITIEPRWQFWEISGYGQRFGFQLNAFFDAGNVYDNGWEPISAPRFATFKYSYGAGFAIAWNLSTIIRVHYAMSPEDTGFDVNFEHNF